MKNQFIGILCRRRQFFLFILFILALSLNVFALEDGSPRSLDRGDYRNLINVSTGVGWVIDMDKYDTLGNIDIYFPLYLFPEDGAVYLNIEQNVPFKNISGTSRFIVPEINYELELGLIKRLWPDMLGSIFYRRQGTAQLDKLGNVELSLIGASFSTEDYLVRDISPGLKWKLSASGVIDKGGMAGGAFLESDFIYNLWERGGMGFNIEGEIDALITHGNIEVDLEVGPKISFYGSQGTINSIVTKYITGHSPLGIDDSGFYLGVMVEAGTPFKGDESPEAAFMEYGGTITFGTGEAGRVLADIDLLGNIPGIQEGYDGLYFAYEAQSFYLSGSDDNLYYVTVAGLEKERDGFSLGFYFNHRSGHLIDSRNDFEKDDLNLYEFGISSPGWHLYRKKKEAFAFGRIGNWGRINFFARLGTNIDNSFVSRWHIDAKIGFRLDLERDIFNLTPYLSNYDEIIGSALLHDTTLGLRRSDGWSYNFKYHYDDQISATQNSALLLAVSKIF